RNRRAVGDSVGHRQVARGGSEEDHRERTRGMTRRLDGLIDATARQLTEGEPAADLSARVVARLDQRRRPRWRLWSGGLLALAAAAGVFVAALRPSIQAPATSHPATTVTPRVENEA